MQYLLDTNILARWVQVAAPEHSIAVAALEQLRDRGDTVFITPQNLVEFWGVATRPIQVNGLGMTPTQADAEMRQIERIIPLLPDDPAILSEWRHLVASVGVSGRQVHDARLAAVMRVHGLSHIFTFNTSDFTRYPGITPVHPQHV